MVLTSLKQYENRGLKSENEYYRTVSSSLLGLRTTVIALLQRYNENTTNNILREVISDSDITELRAALIALIAANRTQVVASTNASIGALYGEALVTSTELLEFIVRENNIPLTVRPATLGGRANNQAIRVLRLRSQDALAGLYGRTRSRIMFDVINGIQDADNFNAIRASVNSSFNTTLNDARRIVRTEYTRLRNQAATNVYMRNGVEYVTWRAVLDDRTRPEHAAQSNSGEFIPVGSNQVFRIVGVSSPPEGPNCRCYLVPFFPD